jgi:predicted transcriptional regulator
MNILNAAQQYAAQGWPVFPCNGKIPLIKGWPEVASIDYEQITEYWRGFPDANIGIVTVPRSGLLLVDVDGPEGESSLTRLAQQHGDLPETLVAKTGRGTHYYYAYPTGCDIHNDTGRKLGHGVDIRATGGFVVAPPSRHASGDCYEWVNPDCPVSQPPEWLIALLTQEPEEKPIPAPSIPIEASKGTRYAEAALTNACALVAGSRPGNRNHTLNAQAYGIGQLVASGSLASHDAESRLIDAATSAGLPNREALATIKSGLKAGEKTPRDLSHVRQPREAKAETAAPEKKESAGKVTQPAFALQSITARELLSREFKPPRWAIPGMLPEGLTILAGRPKCGKSWLAFDLCLAVARGGMALGNQPAQHGKALYLALEDSQRRLQDRLLQLIQEGEAPDDLLFTTECARYDQGGLHALADWLDNNPDCRLVVLDTLGRFRPAGKSGDGYGEETHLLGSLQRLALDRQIALIVIHHTRKAQADLSGGDPLDDVLGSTGLTGVADSIWILKRPRTETVAQLFMTSRDVGESEQVIEFDPDSCTWSLQIEPQSKAQSQERQKILDCLQQTGQPIGPKQIAEATGLSYDSTRHLIRHMEADGSVLRKARGQYISSQVHNGGERQETRGDPL